MTEKPWWQELEAASHIASAKTEDLNPQPMEE